jgi:hypothetical protein
MTLRRLTQVAWVLTFALACYAVPHRLIEIQRDGVTHQQPQNYIAKEGK